MFFGEAGALYYESLGVGYFSFHLAGASVSIQSMASCRIKRFPCCQPPFALCDVVAFPRLRTVFHLEGIAAHAFVSWLWLLRCFPFITRPAARHQVFSY